MKNGGFSSLSRSPALPGATPLLVFIWRRFELGHSSNERNPPKLCGKSRPGLCDVVYVENCAETI